MKKIKLHKTFQTYKSIDNIREVLDSGNLASGGKYYNASKLWFYNHYQAESVFLTHSCTDALEMSALLAGLKSTDEVILPSFTFVSTANAFYLRGCNLKFADSLDYNPNIGIETILPLLSANTKAIVLMHYAGIAVDMDPIQDLAKDRGIMLIEDAAQGIGAKYKGRWLGTIGDIGGISFHETKMITAGEGGCCIINNPLLIDKAEIIFEKGTNKKAFLNHEVSKYEWMDIGSSFGMSELQAALLYSQLQTLDDQLSHRIKLWNLYMSLLKEQVTNGNLTLPYVPDYASINGTHFYIVLNNNQDREELKNYLLQQGIECSFHYLALHKSPFYKNALNQTLKNADRFETCLLRLPIHCEMEEQDVLNICGMIYGFFKKRN